jgi:Lon-like protease
MEDRRTRGPSWLRYVVVSLSALAFLMLLAWNVELPYLAFSSGPVSDAADAVVVEEVDVYPPEGELLMLTVVSQDVNIFEALIAGLDPTIDLVRREAVRPPDETDEEYRNRVLEQMSDSRQISIAVALRSLGYEMQTADVLVIDVLEDRPAAKALEVGDALKAINGLEIHQFSDVTDALEDLQVGEIVEIEISRGGSVLTVQVELTSREDEEGSPMIGISLEELTEPPFPVSIESGVVGGPSAGMMHALAIIDILTPGELTKGHIVAGTGTIRADGTVGNIGGVRQKVVGAEAAGAQYLMVPIGNYEAALTAERRSIEIVPVADIAEALAFLEDLPEPTY